MHHAYGLWSLDRTLHIFKGGSLLLDSLDAQCLGEYFSHLISNHPYLISNPKIAQEYYYHSLLTTSMFLGRNLILILVPKNSMQSRQMSPQLLHVAKQSIFMVTSDVHTLYTGT